MGPVNLGTPTRSHASARVALLVLGVAMLALQSGGEPVVEALRYERDLVTTDQGWRFFSASLVHAGWAHLLLNLVALLIVLLTVGRGMNALQVVIAWTFASLTTTAGLWLWNPDINWYLGASGALHGLLVAGAVPLAFAGHVVGLGILGVLIAKLAWEQIAGPVPGSAAAAGVAVIVDAHLYGAAGGILALLPNAWLARHPARVSGNAQA
jgi:rhomboid family GlyGly-CTERM serine protease